MSEHRHISGLFGGAAVLAITIFGFAASAQAQVTDAQRSAIRSSCRSDFMSNCASVTPGGAEAFQCLKRNESKLSAACRSAVDAVSITEKPAAAAPPPSAAAPSGEKPAAAKPAAAPAAEKPAAAKPAAKPASASTAPASQQPAKKQSAVPKTTTAAVPAAPADADPPPPPPPPNWATVPPRFELQVMRSCRPEVQSICALPAGGGRILNCLATNQANVSAGCSGALDRARAAAVQ